MKMSADTMVTIGAGLALGLTIMYAWKRIAGTAGDVVDSVSGAIGAVADTVTTAAGKVGGAVDTGIAAPVYAIGDALGVPRTNESKCQTAKREGDAWTASIYCPATDFLSWYVNDKPAAPAGRGASGSW